MMRRLPVAVAALSLAGCGGSGDGDRVSSATPKPDRAAMEREPERRAEPRAEPRALPTPQPRRGELKPTQADAERMRPLLRGWANALRAGDPEKAARAFTVPALVANGPAVLLTERDQLVEFNATLPCGAKLLEVQHDGRYVVGTFRLTERPDNRCDGTGNLARVAFVIRGGRIAEWRRVPDARGGSSGPERPEPAPKYEESEDQRI